MGTRGPVVLTRTAREAIRQWWFGTRWGICAGESGPTTGMHIAHALA